MAYVVFNLLAAAALIGIDQAIKLWATNVLQPVGAMPLIPHVVELRFVLNPGMAFSLLSGKQLFLIIATSIALILVAYGLFFRSRGRYLQQAALYNSLGVYLPLITTNCCVLAVTILVVGDYGADVAAMGFGVAYIEALVCAIGAGCGFMLAMVMFSGVRKRVEACDPPAPFKGLPITLIAAAITSLSFMGFGGIVENLFNVTL